MVAFANFRRVRPEQGAFFFFSLRRALRRLLFFVSSHNPFFLPKPFGVDQYNSSFSYMYLYWVLLYKKQLQNNGNTDAITFLHQMIFKPLNGKNFRSKISTETPPQSELGTERLVGIFKNNIGKCYEFICLGELKYILYEVVYRNGGRKLNLFFSDVDD